MKKAILSLFLSLVLLTLCAFAGASDAVTDAYLRKLSAAPGRSLDEVQPMLDALLDFEGMLPDEAVSGFLEFLGRIVGSLCDDHWNDEAFAGALGDDGLISTRHGESGIGYSTNYGAMRAALNNRLSEAYGRYLELTETYFSYYLVDDMAMMISWDDLAQYIIDWSVFKISYPRFLDIETVDSDIRLGVILYAGCFILDNTPVIYKNALSKDVRASYESFLSDPASGDALYYDDIAALYKVWKDNGFKYTKAVQNYINDLEVKLFGAEGEG
jgi:hypothetical protein